MTNKELQDLLKQWPDDMPIAISFDCDCAVTFPESVEQRVYDKAETVVIICG